jgi:CBS domain-containing membrane protein
MEKKNVCSPPSSDDLRAALREMKAYVDITEEDLMRIYDIALHHARERITSRVLVRDVMSKDVVSVRHDADLHEAARLLSEHRISGMPVLDDNGRVMGVISEADLLRLAGMREEHTFKDVLRRILGESAPFLSEGSKVEQAMSYPPVTSKADDDVADVAKILDGRRIKRLPVVDNEGRVLGIISRADIVKMIVKKN